MTRPSCTALPQISPGKIFLPFGAALFLLFIVVGPAAAADAPTWNASPALGAISHGEPDRVVTRAEAEDIRRWAAPPLARRAPGRALDPDPTPLDFRSLPHRKLAQPRRDRSAPSPLKRSGLPLLL